MTELKRSCNTCKHNPVADVGQYPCNECRRDTLPKYEAKVIKEMAKEEAIKFLELEKESTKTLWDSVNHEGGREYFEKSLEVIDMAIKALEQTRWIPVSERLPEDYIHVLCQFTLNGMGECYLAHGVFHVVGGLVMTCNEVIAWMPLPQPYTESEDKE